MVNTASHPSTWTKVWCQLVLHRYDSFPTLCLLAVPVSLMWSSDVRSFEDGASFPRPIWCQLHSVMTQA